MEIYSCLFVGDETDYEQTVKYEEGWWVVHACKEPYHRRELGYTSKGAPQGHPEYLIARRENRLILNLVDAPNPDYIPKEIIDAALEFINTGLKDGKRVLVHCNLGESRSPSIGLLYLAVFTDKIHNETFENAEEEFRKIYTMYAPKPGMRGFLAQNWSYYCKAK